MILCKIFHPSNEHTIDRTSEEFLPSMPIIVGLTKFP